MPEPKVTKISLTTIVTNDGDFCVRREPSTIAGAVADLGILRLTNHNTADLEGDADITLSFDPVAAAALFSPVPASPHVLTPGSSVDWIFKSEVTGPSSFNYQTDPDNCQGQDQGDIIVQ